MSMILPLTKGKYATVSHEDYLEISKYKWCYQKGYAVRSSSPIDGKREFLRMHRVIMNAKPGDIIDHINGNTLDNRRSNLRFCTASQNVMNSKKPINGKTSKYKGVSLFRGVYRTFIRVNKKQVFLGYYKTEEEAAKVYNEAAIKYYGEFAKLNDL